jgi:hypothetical protein
MPDYLLRTTDVIRPERHAEFWPEIESITGVRPIGASEYKDFKDYKEYRLWGNCFELYFVVQTGTNLLNKDQIRALKDRKYLVAQIL